ncbi:MAG: hypothetical protein IIU89_05095 [Bacteroidales bacterium]|nr:hypothetical protein [Bacteroidales bacterium]
MAKLSNNGDIAQAGVNFNGFVTGYYSPFNTIANPMKYEQDNFAAVKIYNDKNQYLWNGFIYAL